jgi:hypothetical protein
MSVDKRKLRNIGWELWDPIGLLREGESWVGKPFADEYDSYLLQAVGQLNRGLKAKDVENFLTSVELDHMGLSANANQSKTAQTVVMALSRKLNEIIVNSKSRE